MSSPTRVSSAVQSNGHSVVKTRPKDSTISDTIQVTSKNSTTSTDLDRQFETGPDHHIHPHPLVSVDEESEGDGTVEIEVTATQLHRLSRTMNRILGSHLDEHPRAIPPSSDLVDHDALVESAHYTPFPARFVHPNSGSFSLHEAEVRVHEELLKALPDTSSSPKVQSIDHRLDEGLASQEDDQPFLTPDDADPSLSEGHSRTSSPISATLFESISRSQSFDEGLGFIDDPSLCDGTSDFEFGSSDRDEVLESSLPALDREKLLSLFGLHYEELLFVQELLSSSTSAPLHPTKHIQGQAHLSSHDSPISPLSTQPPGSVAQPLEQELSVSTSCPGSAVERQSSPHSPDSSSQLISTCSLSHPSPKPKTDVGIGSCQKMRAPRGIADRLQSPTLSSNGSHNPFPILVSPSSTESPDGFSFPLTPPNDPFARSPRIGQICIPSPPTKSASNQMLSDSAPGATDPPHSRQFHSRNGRPIPTTILFRDVEAKAVAANFALNKIPTAGVEGIVKPKKSFSRKKVISITQIGAPKLVSASANLPGLLLEEAGDEINPQLSHQLTKGSSKGGFKLRLKKKRPSEPGLHRPTNLETCEPQPRDDFKTIKVAESTPNLRELIWNPDPPTTALDQAHLSSSPSRNSRHRSRDQTELSSSRKPQGAFTSLRKFMGRRRKSSAIAGDVDTQSPFNSVHTSYPGSQVKDSSLVQIGKHQTESCIESDDAGVCPSSASKVSSSHSVSQPITDPGLTPVECRSGHQQGELGGYLKPPFIPKPSPHAQPNQYSADVPGQALGSQEEAYSTSRTSDSSGLKTVDPLDDIHFDDDPFNAHTTSFGLSAHVADHSRSHVVPDPLDSPGRSNVSNHDLPPVHIIGSMDSDDLLHPQPQSSPARFHSPGGPVGRQTGEVDGDSASNLKVPASRTTWLEVKRGSQVENQSDYASSILDLYGCESSSSPSSRRRFSSLSVYSVGVDLSTSNSARKPSNSLLSPLQAMSSREVQPPLPRLPLLTATKTEADRHPSVEQNEVMAMVQRLQSSTRYSRFDDPVRLSSDLNEGDGDERETRSSFTQPFVVSGDQHPHHPNPHPNQSSHHSSPKAFRGARDAVVDDDDDDEAAVWKQILEG